MELAHEDRHVFAFAIPELGQLQPTRMPQWSHTADFTMSELVNIALGEIPRPGQFPSLIQPSTPNGVADMFPYADDLLGGHPDFLTQSRLPSFAPPA